MKDTFVLEIKRIWQVKHFFVLFLFLGLTLYVVYFGTAKYNDFIAERENFHHYEQLKVTQYVNYEQYGFHGFRVLLQPSPLIIFCHSYLSTLKSNIDIKDIVNITFNYKGQKVFSYYGMAGDFSTLFSVLGSLLMVYFGLNTFPGISSIRFHRPRSFIFKTVCSRYIILNGYFLLTILAAYFFARVLGVRFDSQENITFRKYSLYVMLFLSMFYFLGLLMTVIGRFKANHAVFTYLVWFILIFVIPQVYNMDLEKESKTIKSNELVNLEKLNNGKNFERKAEAYFKQMQEKKVKEIRTIARQFIDEYLQKVMPLNTAIEARLNREVFRLIKGHEKKTIFMPSSFYGFLSRELSSMGYYGYHEFLSYILDMKSEFSRFYFDHRYNHIDQTVKSFITDKENVFLSQSLLPDGYGKALSLTVFYCLLLAGGAAAGLRKILKPPPHTPVQLNIDELEMGKSYFYLARNMSTEEKRALLHSLRSQQAVIIEKPGNSLFDPGISLKAWVQFESHQRRIEPTSLTEVFETLGITPAHLEQRIKNLDIEVLCGTYLGLQLAQPAELFVFDDFLKGVSKEFEQRVKAAIDQFLPRAVILYFSSQVFDIMVKAEKAPHALTDTDAGPLLTVHLNDISLR
jgi:hypothetical protein